MLIATDNSHIFYDTEKHRFAVMDETEDRMALCACYNEAVAYLNAYVQFLNRGEDMPAPWLATNDIATGLQIGNTQASINAAVVRLRLLA